MIELRQEKPEIKCEAKSIGNEQSVEGRNKCISQMAVNMNGERREGWAKKYLQQRCHGIETRELRKRISRLKIEWF